MRASALCLLWSAVVVGGTVFLSGCGREGAREAVSAKVQEAKPADPLTAYHQWFYHSHEQTWNRNTWFGVSILKNPLDMQILQEIIYETKPDLLIEAGTFNGGSAYYFASLFDMLKRGRIVTIDIEDKPGKPKHDRITYLLGSSTSPEIVDKVRKMIRPGQRVMVTLDSNHEASHVLNELKIYSDMVTVGNYLVVEDSNINGHPVMPDFGPGPTEALQKFLPGRQDLVQDKSRERFGVTFNPNGWLKKVK